MLRYSIALGSLLGALWAATADGAGPGPEDYVVRVWGTKQGLPQDAVRAISQTPDGYLWVGTFNGVARFDGNSFQVLQAGNTPGLPNNLISALFCDRHGRLYIGHDTGHVSVLERGKLRKIQMPEDWTRIPIRGFGEDSEGDIWVLNPLWKLAIISPTGEVHLAPEIGASDSPLHFDFSAQDGLLRVVTVRGRCYVAHHRALTPDPDAPPAPSDGRRVIHSVSGGYWAMRENRLSRWVGGKEVEAAGEVNWGEAIWATTCEWDGKIAAGTFRHGLNLAGQDGSRIHYEATGELPSNWISVLFADRNGILWVGTGDGGLAAIWPKRVQVVRPPGEAARKNIQSITSRLNGGIWAATEGAGLFEFDGNAWRQPPDVPGQLPVYSSLWQAEDGRLWAARPTGGLFYLQDQSWRQVPGSGRISGRGALLMETNVLWVAGGHDLLRLSGHNFAEVDRLPGCEGLCCLTLDGAGGVWYGGYGTGLGHWTNNQKVLLGIKDGLPSENILSLQRTRDGSLWIGTDGAGLVRMKNGRFRVISKRQGLLSDTICQIIEDDQSRLWMGTYEGICAASLEDLSRCAEGKLELVKCLVLDTSDGMETRECSSGNQPSVCRTADERLWFATRRGVVVVSPSSIQLNTNPPPVWIERIETDAGPLSFGAAPEPVSLPRGQRRLQVAFNAPCLRAAHRVRFKHRLEPVEPQWVDSGASREVTYARVPPGAYRFQVIACNEDGVWNLTGAAVALTVPPFLWERVWFAPMCWAGGAGAVAVMVLVTMRRRLKLRLERLQQQRALEQERARIARDIHDDLGASLTRITLLSDSAQSDPGNPVQTANRLGRIAVTAQDLTRAMDEIVWAVNPKNDRLDSLVNYIGKFAQDFLSAGDIAYRLEVPPQLPRWPIRSQMRHNLFLAFKEALHNVLKHAAAKKVRVVLTVEAECFRLAVLDDGCGFVLGTPAPAGSPALRLESGNGLANMKTRLEEMGGQCEVRSEPGAGTSVMFTVYVKNPG